MSRNDLLIASIILLAVSLVACASSQPVTSEASALIKESTPVNTPTRTVTPSPLAPTPKFDPTQVAPEVIATTTVEVGATKEATAAKDAELVKQIDLFLNAKGPFTKEILDLDMFRPSDIEGEYKIGVLGMAPEMGSVWLQGMFIDHRETSDGIVLFMGMQDKNGGRFVTPIKIYNRMFQIHDEAGAGYAFGYNTIGKNFNFNSTGKAVLMNEKNDVVDYLNDRVGKFLAFQTSVSDPPPLSAEMKKWMLDNGYKDPELADRQLSDLIKSVTSSNKDLVLNLWHSLPENLGDVNIDSNIKKLGEASTSPI
jgi:hypothetical protein